MSAAACKVIIDGGVAQLYRDLEKVLLLPETAEAIGKDMRDGLLEQLIDSCLASLTGRASFSGAKLVAAQLVSLAVLDPRIWEVYAPLLESTKEG